MIYKDRQGNIIDSSTGQDKILTQLYSTAVGRAILKPLVNPALSNLGRKLACSSVSKIFINPFINKFDINMDEYELKPYSSYNDFFTRKVKAESRPIDMNKDTLISPADGKVTVYNIDKHCNFNIKNSNYSVSSILRDDNLAKEYDNGICVVIRLSVDNYHRYCYIDNAVKGQNVFIRGKLHTVNPIAFDYFPVFKENSREYCVLDTENFGKVIQMEVGALMVGKIVNYDMKPTVSKGIEKGKFEFGGSTIVLFFKKNSVSIDEDIIQNSSQGIETLVKMGQHIGIKLK